MLIQIAVLLAIVVDVHNANPADVHADVKEEKGYNSAMDFWRQMSPAMDHKQYKGLRELISQNEELPRDVLEKKIGEWSKTVGLEVVTTIKSKHIFQLLI